MKKALIVTGTLLGIAGAVYVACKKNQRVKTAIKKGLNWAERQGNNLLKTIEDKSHGAMTKEEEQESI